MIIDAIEQDPDWKGGDYEAPPRGALRLADAMLTIVGSSPMADRSDPTRDAVNRAVAENKRPPIDASDLLYALRSSADYDPSADLEKITAQVLFVNSADDFINPPVSASPGGKSSGSSAAGSCSSPPRRTLRPRHPHLGGVLEEGSGGTHGRHRALSSARDRPRRSGRSARLPVHSSTECPGSPRRP